MKRFLVFNVVTKQPIGLYHAEAPILDAIQIEGVETLHIEVTEEQEAIAGNLSVEVTEAGNYIIQ